MVIAHIVTIGTTLDGFACRAFTVHNVAPWPYCEIRLYNFDNLMCLFRTCECVVK